MDLLRISTAGSVDDGKSTLIGRLLYDHNALTREQEELLQRKSLHKPGEDLDLSVITDGLTAEREQGITIDVANIYFSSERRKFIIADSPGHVEYTRNMVTGASNSDIAIIVVDARKGLSEQTFRHFFISNLLAVKYVVFCINKMDLVDYSEEIFLDIHARISALVADRLERSEIIPISALRGDNVLKPSENMTWYDGPTLDDIMHSSVSPPKEDSPFRFDVQGVYLDRQSEQSRCYAGVVGSGSVKSGDSITVLPSGKQGTVKEVRKYKQLLEEAVEGDSILLSLNEEIDISRGVMLSKTESIPQHKQEFLATLVWMDEQPAVQGSRLILKSGSRELKARITGFSRFFDPEHPGQTFSKHEVGLNDIAEVSIGTAEPAFLDSYHLNKRNGSFILIDPASNGTSAVGFVK